MPEWRKGEGADPFPYSLVASGVSEGDVRQALRRHVFLLLGDKDIDAEHKDLRRTKEAMRQGATRLERGENYFRAIGATADALGEKLAWQLREVPGVAHEGGPMSRYAADAIFGAK
jgi:hypothetical protein